MQYLSLFLVSFGFMTMHFVSSTKIRSRFINRFGELAWLGLFSVLSIGFLGWMIFAYLTADRIEDLWQMPIWWLWVNAVLMFVSLTFILLGYISKNPAAGETRLTQYALKGKHLGKGVFAITRHPSMWGVAIMSFAHMVSNGSVEAQIFFGSLLGTAIIGSYLQDKRKARDFGDDWAQYAAKTSWLPFKAMIEGRARFEFLDIKWWQITLTAMLWYGLYELHVRVFSAYLLPI